MKCARRFGVVIAAVAMLTVCRPASATEILFSFTAATLDTVFDSTPGFSGGECGTESQVTLLCGAYQVAFIPNVSGTLNAIASPVPANVSDNNGAWDAEGLSGEGGSCTLGVLDSCSIAYFYSDFSSGGDMAVTLLTTNPFVSTNSDVILGGVGPLAASDMPGGDAFTFGFTPDSSDVNVNNISFTLEVEVAQFADSEGAAEGDKGATLVDESFTTPEPSGLWLCLAGILVLGLHNRRRWFAGRWNHHS